ncbi:MAG TPA: hypothetical protein DCZ69_00790, partial [Syntrophobacteraceae bacterium]|nr:hypothetical protein [Syntrophobacteraceae bacterium]
MRLFSGPLFAVWMVALVVLVGLVVWSRTDKRPTPKPAKITTATTPTSPAPEKPAPATAKTNARNAAKTTSEKTPGAGSPSTGIPAQRDGAAMPVSPSIGPHAKALLPEPQSPPLFEEYRHIQRESTLDRLDKLFNDFFKAEGISGDQIRRRQVKHSAADGAFWYVRQVEIQLGPDKDLTALKSSLLQTLSVLGPEIEVKAEGSNLKRFRIAVDIAHRPSHEIWFVAAQTAATATGISTTPIEAAGTGRKPKEKGLVPLGPGLPKLGKVAIVIDDLGLDLKVAKDFMALPIALTLSVMPRQVHSREIAQMAHTRGLEVLLHMPMEPHGYPRVNPGPGALLVSMDASQLRSTLQEALASVPHASGVNNHMGSTFTEQNEPLKRVLNELHNRHLYFLDSYTSHHSVACSVADQVQVPCARRDIFLDHELTEDFVRSQLQRLIREAKIQGTGVAIGHPHPTTLKVLKQEA